MYKGVDELESGMVVGIHCYFKHWYDRVEQCLHITNYLPTLLLAYQQSADIPVSAAVKRHMM
jgi:hypothetical protein